jgi:hypothetical protein
MRTQINALTKLTASTWGASLSISHLLYTSIVCPIVTKAFTAWHSPIGPPLARKWLLTELSPLQNSCLRAISGAYKATPIWNLEAEVEVPPLGIHLDGFQARFWLMLEESEVQEVVWLAVKRVRWSLDRLEEDRNRGRRPRRRNQRAGRGGIDVDGVEQMGERGGHWQHGQEDEVRRTNSAQDPPELQPPINHPNRLSWAHG